MSTPCCARVIVVTLEETLDCPGDWHWLPGVGWIHDAPLRRTVTAGSELDTDAEAVVIAAGRLVWQMAVELGLPRVGEAADDLVLALDTYDAIRDGTLSPAAPDPHAAAGTVLRLLARIIGMAPALAGDTP